MGSVSKKQLFYDAFTNYARRRLETPAISLEEYHTHSIDTVCRGNWKMEIGVVVTKNKSINLIEIQLYKGLMSYMLI